MSYCWYRDIKVRANLKSELLSTFCVKFEDDDEDRCFNYHLPLDFALQMELEDIDKDDKLDDATKEQQKQDMKKIFLGDPKKYIDKYSFNITFDEDGSMTIHLFFDTHMFSNLSCGEWIMQHYPDYPFEVLDFEDAFYIPAIEQLYDDELSDFMSYNRFVILDGNYYQDAKQAYIKELIASALGSIYAEDPEYKFLKLLVNKAEYDPIFKKYQNKDFETLKAEVLERKKAKEEELNKWKEEHVVKASVYNSGSKF